MAGSDGQVKIIIDTNAKEVLKDMNSVNKAFDKNADTMKSATSATSAYEEVIQDNIKLLREAALGGNQNTAAFKKLAAQTREYKKALADADNVVQKATGGFDKQQSSMGNLVSTAKKLAGAYIGIQSVRALINYSNQAVEAYRVQERAILQLDQTLQNAGVYTYEYSQQIQRLASEIQSYSNFGDEVIIKAHALGQAYIGNIKITEDLTKATVDFAAATGMDLESAFTLVGKSVGSSTNALGRYGIELQKGMTESQKMEAITKQLGQRYEGTAAKMADTSIQLKNALGDLSEQFGQNLDPAVKNTQSILIRSAQALTAWLQRVRAMNAEIKSLGIDDLQTRIQKNNEIIDRLSQQKTFKGQNNERIKQLRNDNDLAQAQIDRLKKQQAELANLSSQKGFKVNDEFGSVDGSIGSSNSSNVQKIKDDYEKLQAAVQTARREIELAALAHGTSSQEVQNAFVKYNQLNTQLSSIGALFDNEKNKVDATKGAYQQLQERIQALKTELLNMGAEGGIGTAQFEQLKNEYISTMEQIKEVDGALVDEMGKDWDNLSKNISSALGSTLVSALQGGQSALQAFSSVAVSLLQKVLDKMLEMAIITPILNSLTGGVGGSLFGGFRGLFANGAAFNKGNVVPFAKGGVVSKPTIFPMANGGTGLMGEAGAEAVMPLRRMSNGRLGVEASGGGEGGKAVQVNIYNQSGANVETRQRDDGSMDIIIKKVNEALMNERTSSGFRAAYQREDRKGLQAV